MKIEDNRVSDYIPFMDLSIGDCFIFNNEHYIKIDRDTAHGNVFNIEHNQKDTFGNGARVLPINAKIVIG